jgi:hypothetical protein
MALAAQLYYSNKQPLCLDKGYGNPTSRDAVGATRKSERWRVGRKLEAYLS